MSTTSFKIQAYGTPSSLVPGSIQNARNNNLEILTIVQTIPANPTGINHDEPLAINPADLNGKEIIGSSADISFPTGSAVSIGTDVNVENLLAPQTYTSAIVGVSLLANLSSSVPGGVIKVRSAGTANEFTLTLRLILRKL